LKEEGYISSFKMNEENKKKTLRITLKYDSRRASGYLAASPRSRPGRRVYSSSSDITGRIGGLGSSILTTPKGVMSGKRARKSGVGGEVLLEVS